MIFRCALLALFLIANAAHAKRFRNAYVSFELPPNWNCKLEGSEWVCENDFSAKTKEAIIILSAKEVGPTDTLQAYMAHLQTPRTLQGKGGVVSKSKIVHVKERLIANQMWVDGMHEGSEVGPYFTRYLATIKDRIAILVPFSAHKQHYTKYSGDFIKAVESLRVVATKDTLGDRGGGMDARRGAETIGAPIGQNIPSYDTENLPGEGSGRGKKYFNFLLLAILAAVVGFIFYRRANQKPPPRPPGKSSGGAQPPPKKAPKK